MSRPQPGCWSFFSPLMIKNPCSHLALSVRTIDNPPRRHQHQNRCHSSVVVIDRDPGQLVGLRPDDELRLNGVDVTVEELTEFYEVN